MDDKKLKKIWLFSIFIIIVLFAVYIINLNDDNFSNEVEHKENYSIVNDYNSFYTVNSCIYRYLTYLQSNSTNSLMNLLDEDFIKNNNINEGNVLNYLTKYEGNLNFNSRKMYEEKVNSNITKYYVYGYVEKDIMDSFPEQNEAYFIVKLDKKNEIFTIMPYNGDIFK